jgi:hypothetical protein
MARETGKALYSIADLVIHPPSRLPVSIDRQTTSFKGDDMVRPAPPSLDQTAEGVGVQ